MINKVRNPESIIENCLYDESLLNTKESAVEINEAWKKEPTNIQQKVGRDTKYNSTNIHIEVV